MNTGFRYKQSELGVFSAGADAPVSKLEKNGRVIGLTMGQFSLIDLIHSILKKTGPAQVICSTWSAGIKDANQVKWLLDSNLITSFSLITDHSYATRQSKYSLTIEQVFGPENIRTSEIHAKFVLIKNAEWNIAIRTSMNLNANKTCETFEIDDSIEVYDFYMNFVNHVFGFMGQGFTASSWKCTSQLRDFFGAETKKNSEFSFWSNE